eukprot:3538612-Alexandrium_andersonii.AAC.1
MINRTAGPLEADEKRLASPLFDVEVWSILEGEIKHLDVEEELAKEQQKLAQKKVEAARRARPAQRKRQVQWPGQGVSQAQA